VENQEKNHRIRNNKQNIYRWMWKCELSDGCSEVVFIIKLDIVIVDVEYHSKPELYLIHLLGVEPLLNSVG